MLNSYNRFKRVIESLLGSKLLRPIGCRRRTGQRLVLAYHNVLQPGAACTHGDRSLHMPYETFGRHMDLLASGPWTVVSPDTPLPGPTDPPQVVITFDDAYAGALSAMSLLAARGLPATLFVPPERLDSDTLWWDLIPDMAVRPDLRAWTLDTCQGDQEVVLAECAREEPMVKVVGRMSGTKDSEIQLPQLPISWRYNRWAPKRRRLITEIPS